MAISWEFAATWLSKNHALVMLPQSLEESNISSSSAFNFDLTLIPQARFVRHEKVAFGS